MRFVDLADEIVSALVNDPNASIRVVVEVWADFPQGVPRTSPVQ